MIHYQDLLIGRHVRTHSADGFIIGRCVFDHQLYVALTGSDDKTSRGWFVHVTYIKDLYSDTLPLHSILQLRSVYQKRVNSDTDLIDREFTEGWPTWTYDYDDSRREVV